MILISLSPTIAIKRPFRVATLKGASRILANIAPILFVAISFRYLDG